MTLSDVHKPMTSAILHQRPTYDSPSASLEAMEYTEPTAVNTDILQFNQTSDLNPFKINPKSAGLIDPMLDNLFNGFNLDNNYWSQQTQFGALGTMNPTLSSLDSNQSSDTGYVSQEASPDKSPIGTHRLPFADDMTVNLNKTETRPRKRSSTKTTTFRLPETTSPARKSRRTSKAISTDMKFDEEEDPKREQFLARYREAASKCRQKKKEWTQDLEQRARDLSSQKQMLTTYLAMLKNELLMLKCKCLEHSDCGCEAIRDYLKNTVTTMRPANAVLYSKLEEKDANDVSSEVARRQSIFGMNAMSSNDMVTSPSSNGETGEAEFLRLETELHAAVKD